MKIKIAGVLLGIILLTAGVQAQEKWIKGKIEPDPKIEIFVGIKEYYGLMEEAKNDLENIEEEIRGALDGIKRIIESYRGNEEEGPDDEALKAMSTYSKRLAVYYRNIDKIRTEKNIKEEDEKYSLNEITKTVEAKKGIKGRLEEMGYNVYEDNVEIKTKGAVRGKLAVLVGKRLDFEEMTYSTVIKAGEIREYVKMMELGLKKDMESLVKNPGRAHNVREETVRQMEKGRKIIERLVKIKKNIEKAEELIKKE